MIEHQPRDVKVMIIDYSRYLYCGRQPKITLNCKILEFGRDFEREIQAHYRLDRIDGRKRCYANRCSKIVRDLGRLLPDYCNETPLPLSRLKQLVAIARTRVVEKDMGGVEIAKQQQYEVIDYFKKQADA